MPHAHESNQTASRSPLHYGLVILGVIILVAFCALGLARFGYTSILPAMQEAMRLSNLQTGQLQSWNLLGYLLTVAGAGILASRFGPRVVIAFSLFIVAVGMALTALIPVFSAACIGRFLAGVGGAGSNVPAMGLVSAWFGRKRRGVATGAAVAGSSLGLMVTGPMVPAILQHYPSGGWRISWWVLSAMTLAIGAVAYLCLRNRPADLGLQAIGESTAEQDGPLNRSSSSRPSGPPGEETELATTSVRQTGARSSTMNSGSEKQSQSSVSTLSWGLVYRSKVLWQLAVIYFGFGFSYIIYSTFFVRYLTAEAGFSSSQAGALWFQIGVVSIISGFLWGGVSDRCGRKTALLWVLSLQSIAFFLSGITREAWSLYLAAGLFAITAWSVPALMAALCGDLFGGRLAPAALGLITMVFGIGQALGPLAAGIIADATHSFGPALMLGGLAALVLGVGGTLLPKHWDR